MSFIVASISDIHFPVKNIGAQDQYKILYDQFIEKIKYIPKLDLIVIGGDLFDHKVLTSSDAALYATMFIGNLVDLCRQKGTSMILLQGTLSHDANQLRLYYHYMNDTTVDFRIVTQLQFEIVKGLRILCIPELYGIDESIYQKFLFGSGFYDLAIMHGTFKGAVYGDNAGNSRLFCIDDFLNCRGPILAGHVHKPGCFNDHFYYNGSPYSWCFDDDHDKGFILLAYDKYTCRYYLDWQRIVSYKYYTLTYEDIVKDPQYTIQFIDNLKKKQHIDFIRVIFTQNINRLYSGLLIDNYRNNNNVSLIFNNKEDILQKQNDNIGEYQYLTDPKLSDEEKLVIYVNSQKGIDNYISVEELQKILSE